MSDRKYYVLCADNCKFESMTKEQILSAIEQAVSTGEIKNVDTGFVTKLKEQNANKALKFWVGTTAEYNALETKIENCFYIITDDTTADDINAMFKGYSERITTLEANQNKNGATLLEIGDQDLNEQTVSNIKNYTLVNVVLSDGATILCNVKIDGETFLISGILSVASILSTTSYALISNSSITIKGTISGANGTVTNWAFVNWVVQETAEANRIPTISHLDCAMCKIIGIM